MIVVVLSIIVAASTNDVIGAGGDLPWHISEDLRRFKSITMGKPVIMGRLTWESIGKPLPGRRNVVLTSQERYAADACDVVRSLDDALELVADSDEVMIIGGSRVYREALPRADRVYLTRIHATFEGDAYFPSLRASDWNVVSSEDFPRSGGREFGYTFQVLERVRG